MQTRRSSPAWPNRSRPGLARCSWRDEETNAPPGSSVPSRASETRPNRARLLGRTRKRRSAAGPPRLLRCMERGSAEANVRGVREAARRAHAGTTSQETSRLRAEATWRATARASVRASRSRGLGRASSRGMALPRGCAGRAPIARAGHLRSATAGIGTPCSLASAISLATQLLLSSGVQARTPSCTGLEVASCRTGIGPVRSLEPAFL